MMALEAIYGPDLVVFENNGGLRYFEVSLSYHEYFSIVIVSGNLALMVCQFCPRFTFGMMCLMALKCVQSFHQLMCVPKMMDALMVHDMVMDQTCSVTSATLSIFLL